MNIGDLGGFDESRNFSVLTGTSETMISPIGECSEAERYEEGKEMEKRKVEKLLIIY